MLLLLIGRTANVHNVLLLLLLVVELGSGAHRLLRVPLRDETAGGWEVLLQHICGKAKKSAGKRLEWSNFPSDFVAAGQVPKLAASPTEFGGAFAAADCERRPP